MGMSWKNGFGNVGRLANIAQINSAVAQLGTSTQQNAAPVEQMAASEQALTIVAGAVDESIQVFRVGGGSRSSVDALALRRSSKPQRGSYSEQALSAA
jgi:hypothetical protein